MLARVLPLILALLAAPLAAEAQQASVVWRVGVLANTPSPHLDEAFRQGLRDLGWIEGRNIVLDYRYSEGRNERLPGLAADLLSRKPDLMVAWAAPEAAAAKRATAAIPIVFLVHGDPVSTGDVSSLAHPGGNMTGLSQMHPELSAKQLEVLKQAFPRIVRVAVLWNATNPAKLPDWRETQTASHRLGLVVRSFGVQVPADFDAVFGVLTRERPDALMTLADPLTYRYRAQIAEFTARVRLPAVYALREYVEAGGLMAYGVDLRDLFRRGATYVDKILRGAKPGDLPIEQPTKFELVINLKTAKALGLTIPPSLLLRADEVIQ
jgi:putative ABC transport system substrate-binding protein